jgi:hypothetical protein
MIMADLRNLLKISDNRLEEINALLTDPGNELINELLEVIEAFGGPQEINRRAKEAAEFEKLMAGLKDANSPYVDDLNWLMDQKDSDAFISMPAYYDRVLGPKAKSTKIEQQNAVTLEISALQYFPWLIARPLHSGAQHGRTGNRQRRYHGHRSSDADHRCHLCRNA